MVGKREQDKLHAVGAAAGQVRTLADVARIAGVSPGTVSRALAGKSLVNVETRERIRAIAHQHGFRPNQMASRLRSRRTGVIGVVMPPGHERRQPVADPFFLALLGHLTDQLAENGYDLMLSRAVPDGTSDWLERITCSGMVDGVMVIGQSNQFDVIEQVAAGYRPVVVWGHCRPGQTHCVVGTDNEAGGRMAVRTLVEAGARRLVFLGDTTGIEIATRFRGAAAEAQAAQVPLSHLPADLAGEGMPGRIRDALAEMDMGIDGIVAASDLVAMAALRTLHEIGRPVPDGVQIVGFEDLPLAGQTMPALTTIRQDIAAGARTMVERLRARIEGENAGSLIMAPQLVRRGSTRG